MKQTQHNKSYHSWIENEYYHSLLHSDRFISCDQPVSEIKTGRITTKSENEIVYDQKRYIVIHHTREGLVCVDLQRAGQESAQLVQLANQWFPHRLEVDFNMWMIKNFGVGLGALIVTLSTESILSWKGRCYHDLNIVKKEKVRKKKVKLLSNKTRAKR